MLKSPLVTVMGLVTSVLTAIVLALIERWTGFSLFTFSFWLVVPAGAMLCGVAAASGYWAGCRWLHVRPGALLALQMVIVAGATHVLIYYLQYASLVLEDGRRVSDLLPFSAYLRIALTSAHYSIGHGNHDVGEVGRFGYWLGGLEFVGFLLGGLVIFAALRARPYCEPCRRYLGVLRKAEQHHATAEDAARRGEALLALELSSREFAEACRPIPGKGAKGSGRVTVELLECPLCLEQRVRVEVQGHNGREWKDLGETQILDAPRSVDLRPAFDLPVRRGGAMPPRSVARSG